MLARAGRKAVALLVAVLVPLAGVTFLNVQRVSASLIFTESFKNNAATDSQWVIGGSNFTPCLTASGGSSAPIQSCRGASDTNGRGALRLTDAANSASGFLLYNRALPSTAGLDISFDQFQYSGSGADGIDFFLTDGSFPLTAPGAFGGYLGYAGGKTGVGTGVGVAHGLFGLGLDAYGNYTNFENTAAQDGGNCPASYTPTSSPNTITLRGPGNADEVNYCHIASAPAGVSLRVDRTAPITVRIVIDPSSNVNPKVTFSLNGTQTLQVAEPALTPTIKFGWTASTGGATDIHEIRNLSVSSFNPLNPSLTLSNSVSGGTYVPGGTGLVKLTLGDASSANFETNAVTLTAPLPAGMTAGSVTSPDVDWDCSLSTSTNVKCTYTPTGFGLAPGTTAGAVSVPLTFGASYSQRNAAITATATSSDGGTPTTTATFTVAPTVTGGTSTTVANTAASFATTATGTGPFTWTVLSPPNPTYASGSFDASGNYNWSPASNSSGTSSVQFVATDSTGASSATQTIVLSANPAARPVSGTVTAPSSGTVTPGAPTGTGPFSWALVATPPSASGTASMDPNTGVITFTPAAGFSGAVPTFRYTVTGRSNTTSAPATIDITVNKPTPPGVSPVSGTIDANTSFSTTVPAPTGTPPFSYSINTPPPAGTETIDNSGKLSFTPPAGASNVYNSTYQALDQYGQSSANGQVQITVRPVAQSASASTTAPNALSFTPPAPTGTGPFTYSATPPQTHGSLSLNGSTGQVSYTPALGYTGTFSFPYTVADAASTPSSSKTITISVSAPAPPVASTWSRSFDADTTISGASPNPLSGVGPFSYAVVSPPSGTLNLLSGGGYTYTPVAGASGVVTWTYRVTDAYGQSSAPATVTFSIRPTAPDLSATTTGPQSVALTPAPGTVDGSGPFTYTVASTPAHGSVVVSGAIMTYTPVLGYSGADSFTYHVTGAGGTTSAPDSNAVITVNKPAPPVANPISITTVSGGSNGAVPSVQSGVGPFSWTDATQPSHGSSSWTGSQFSCTSSAPYSGPDSFTFTVTDAYGQPSAPTTASVTVLPLAGIINGSGTGPSAVVARAPQPSGTGPFTYSLSSTPPAGDGTAAIDSSTGTVTFTPAYSFTGAVPTFTYTATDAFGDVSPSAPINITVNRPGAPGVSPASGSTSVNTAVDVATPAASGAQPLTYAISAAPAHGTATINSSGGVHYVPASNYSGLDTLQYTASDRYAQTSAPATVSLTITPGVANGSANVQAPSVLSASVPGAVGSGPFTYQLVTAPSNGSLTLNSNGSFTYLGNRGFAGTDTFRFTATDAQGVVSPTATESITVAPPVPPTDSGKTITTPSNTVGTADGSAGATGTGPLTYVIASTPDPRVGTASVSPSTGLLSFTPASNTVGMTSFTYTTTDPWGQTSAPATVSVTVTLPPAPTVAARSLSDTPAHSVSSGDAASGAGPFTYSVTQPSVGTSSVDSLGMVTYSAADHWSGHDSFTLTAYDRYGQASTPATIAVEVDPTVSNVSASGTGPAPVTVTPAAPDGSEPFQYRLSSTIPAGQGTLSIDAATGLISFTPAPGFSGPITTQRYHVVDARTLSSSDGTIDITLNKPGVPVAAPESASTTVGTPVDVAGSATGTAPLSYSIATPPASGTATINPSTGVMHFVPAPGASGVVTLSYVATDQYSQTSTPALVTITVAPVASAGAGTGSGTSPIVVTAPTPAGTGPFSCQIASQPPAADGAVTVDAATCTFTFTPVVGFSGPAAFTYTVTDGAGVVSAPATITDTVTKPAPPTGQPSTAVTTAGIPVTYTPAAPTGVGPFSFALATPPAQGTAVINAATGAITYTPAAGSSAAVPFTYTVTDAYSQSSVPITSTVTVLPIGYPAFKQAFAGSGPLAISIPTPTGTGPFSCALVNSSLPPASEGAVTRTASPCVVTFAPATSYLGIVHLQYVVTDLTGNTSAPATLTYEVDALTTTTTPTPPTPATLDPVAQAGSGTPNPDTGSHLQQHLMTGGALTGVGILLILAALVIPWRRRPGQQDDGAS